MRKESELRQYHCRNSTKVGERKIKSRSEKILIFGNTIIKIPSAHTCYPSGCLKCECVQGKPNVGKKKLAIVAMRCQKWEEKKIVVAEITCEELKKKCYVYNIFTTFLQQITGN